MKHIMTSRNNHIVTYIMLWCIIGSGILLPQNLDAHNLNTSLFNRHFFGHGEFTQSLTVGDLNG
ncbi:MAG: hypothetical protein AAGF95_01750, partial [Chloroflexota bacterium]